MATKKKVNKKATAKKVNINLKDSYTKIIDTAVNINNQVLNTAGDVAENMMENGEQIKEVAVGRAKETIAKVKETVNMDNIKTATKTINDYTIKTADELVDTAMESGQKWQGITNKAVKGGLKLAAKQQDIMFDTLETIKGQLTDSAVKLKKILNN